MRIAVVGGTGKEGRGMAMRWARAGHDVVIGSRDAARAREQAALMQALSGGRLAGADNAAAAAGAEVVVLSVPYEAHAQTIQGIKAALGGRIVLDITVPLSPPHVRKVHLPAGRAAALETQALLGPGSRVVAALHHVSATHLGDLDHAVDCDVLACSDDQAALQLVLGLIRDLGLRAFDAGALQNAVALESLTPVLIHLTRRYKADGVGIRLTGIRAG